MGSITAKAIVVVGGFTIKGHVDSDLPSASAAGSNTVLPVCRRLNADQRALTADRHWLAKRLHATREIGRQRDAIWRVNRRLVARSGSALSAFEAVAPPGAVAREVTALWTVSLKRLRAYDTRLERVGTRRELLGAIAPVTASRAHDEERAVTIDADLERLGGSRCHIAIGDPTPVPLPGPVPRPDVPPDARPPRQVVPKSIIVATAPAAAPRRPDVVESRTAAPSQRRPDVVAPLVVAPEQ